jgi:hypothetical protein
MKQAKNTMPPLLERMGRIQRMERGKVCRMAGRPHFNHQTWDNGRNVVRYVPAGHVAALQAAIDGYRLFMELARQYAEQIIQRTRSECSHKPPSRKPSACQKDPPGDGYGKSTKDV